MNFRIAVWIKLWAILILFGATGGTLQGQSEVSRRVVDLTGQWNLTVEGTTRKVQVPGTFERQIAESFDGVAEFERKIKPIDIPVGHRLLIRFEGVATDAQVWFNDVALGSHVGAWTPFVFDATDAIKTSASNKWLLRVRVDEKVGHNTQGFLPIIQPHFGGIWKGAQAIVVPQEWIDADRLMAVGDWTTGKVRLAIPVRSQYRTQGRVEISARRKSLVGSPADWRVLGEFDTNVTTDDPFLEIHDSARGTTALWSSNTISAELPISDAGLEWTPQNPRLFELRVRWFSAHGVDEVITTFGFKQLIADKHQWKLNGQPLMIRGVLNWGYAPPGTAPSLDEAVMRSEIGLAKSYGFNLMKFCLWVPPRRYLELCDEVGMLTWIEYPTWHPQLTNEHQAELEREYGEFFAYDRNHVSVILRSLTCETGSGADLDVIRALYNQCKSMVPGAIVEDDSSWIEWNRISDFYDDHPYGNNHTWPATLQRLNDYIAAREIKPLVLGEAIAADTWTSPCHLMDWYASAAPGHRPGFFADNSRWLTDTGLDSETIRVDSLRYAHLMRKYQIEAYRRLVPSGGYVVSVIRDFPLAGMGLFDYAGREKWSKSDWTFHGETMLLLDTPNDRRSYRSEEPIRAQIVVSHFAPVPVENGQLTITLNSDSPGDDRVLNQKSSGGVDVTPAKLSEFAVELSAPRVTAITGVRLKAVLSAGDRTFENEWRLWIFPRHASPSEVVVHPSLDNKLGDFESLSGRPWPPTAAGQVSVAAALDPELLEWVGQGGSLLLLPNGAHHSFALDAHWFLRGGPAIFPWAQRLDPDASPSSLRDALIELQHFDLANHVVPQIDSMLANIHPWIALWDNHDRKETRTHGLVFEIPVGHGTILISALRHDGKTNAAGQWLLRQMVDWLGQKDSNQSLDERREQNLARLQAELGREELELHTRPWKFSPDADEQGEKRNWHRPDFDDSSWPTITADRHWEGQGHESLDNWAWYRLRVTLDEKWKAADKLYLNFTGIDDHYRLFIDGSYVGGGGDIATKKTAFDERKSFDISSFVKNRDEIQIAVAVYDWYGAGGIFRPVTLSTMPLSDDRPWLK